MSDWRRVTHKPHREQWKVRLVTTPLFTSPNIGASGPENVRIQETRMPPSRALDWGRVFVSANV